MSSAGAVDGAHLTAQQRQLRRLLPELHRLRRAAIYTRDAYQEEAKALDTRLMDAPYTALYLALEIMPWWCLAALVGVVSVVTSAMVSSLAAHVPASWQTTVQSLTVLAPQLAAGLESVLEWALALVPTGVALAFAVQMRRRELCARMQLGWQKLFQDGNVTYARWQDANSDGDSAVARALDPGADIQRLQATYDALYNQGHRTSNGAYETADKKLDQYWLPKDHAESTREFGIA